MDYEHGFIDQLEGLESIRMRADMYAGSLDERGLHHLVFELLQNSVDEHAADFCSHIEITIHADNSVTVADDGRGIPVELHPKFNRPIIELVLSKPHFHVQKPGETGYRCTTGVHSVGAKCTIALSAWVKVEVCRDGKVWSIGFQRGVVNRPLEILGTSTGPSTGTKITFFPDSQIFHCPIEYNFDILARRLQEKAFCHPGLQCVLKDERKPLRESHFQYKNGLTEYVQELAGMAGIKCLHRHPISIRSTGESELGSGEITVEYALQFTDGAGEHTLLYTNALTTPDGGTPIPGYRKGLKRAIRKYANINQLLQDHDPEITGVDTREGTICIISVSHQRAMFTEVSRRKLMSREVEPIAASAVYTGLSQFLEENPESARKIVANALNAARSRRTALDFRAGARTRP